MKKNWEHPVEIFLGKGKLFHLHLETEKVFFGRLANKHAPTSSRFLDKLDWHILSTKHFILELFGSLEWKLLHIKSQPLVQPISADSLFRPDLLIGRWGMQLIWRQGPNIKTLPPNELHVPCMRKYIAVIWQRYACAASAPTHCAAYTFSEHVAEVSLG